ncbi:hypothetical protein MP478_04560 [Chryseobacterium sp. WG14]|uniref:hypothetical protein n=1 Tax=Chryseobacterium sp. WG14 TaxID=2926909 RepID=UPI00211F388E|nr:hypothetical protein [Chryseobacterium sp. WG14]MCQ9638652.1 hypothetical protein [Chryseobacterium sp. WG14]
MKKLKLIILTAVVSIVVLSCSGDRDENVVKPAKTSNQKIKLNNSELQRDDLSTVSAIQDTIRPPQQAVSEDPITEAPDGEIVHPGDVKPPKGGK